VPRVIELRPGVWHWSARHPQWTSEDDLSEHGWGPEVSCYAFASEDRVVLVDPVLPDGGLDQLIESRDAVIVLTCPWHGRDAVTIGLPLFAPPPDRGDPDSLPASRFRAGESLPFGVEAFAGLEPIDLVLWFEAHRALVFGDTLIDVGNGLELPDDWGPSGISHADVLTSLSGLLELPIELALPTHGPPADRRVFERAVT
jgi:glyoxylase-like metal-dependent hydrolase (beta-lactamase superfamily II)